MEQVTEAEHGDELEALLERHEELVRPAESVPDHGMRRARWLLCEKKNHIYKISSR